MRTGSAGFRKKTPVRIPLLEIAVGLGIGRNQGQITHDPCDTTIGK